MGFLLVGWGYRSRAWWEAARGTGVECLGVVVRTPRPTPAPTFTSLEDALAAQGRSEVHGIELINRGYENFLDKLQGLGAEVSA